MVDLLFPETTKVRAFLGYSMEKISNFFWLTIYIYIFLIVTQAPNEDTAFVTSVQKKERERGKDKVYNSVAVAVVVRSGLPLRTPPLLCQPRCSARPSERTNERTRSDLTAIPPDEERFPFLVVEMQTTTTG